MRADRWFRWLLRLVPSDMRSDYGDEMARVFREQRRDAGGRIGVLVVWWRAVKDLLAVGPREHLAQLRQDIRYALRGMRRNPGFVAVAVLTLALGIGANTAIFSVIHAVALRPLPYEEPDRLVAVWNRWDGTPAARLSDPEYLDYAERSRSLDIAALAPSAVNVAGGASDPQRVEAAFVSANTLRVLGTRPALGRGFEDDDERPGARPVVLLSDAFWRQQLNADAAVVGRTLTINGVPHDVIGVLPEGFAVPFELTSGNRVSLVLPLTLNRAAARNRRGGHYLFTVARLRPGETVNRASAELDGIIAQLIGEYPSEHDQGNFGIVVRDLREDLLGGARPVLLVLGGAVGLVLMLACANVANLLLARGESRRREIAVRTALGASRLRIARQLLTEASVLALAGTVAGLLIAFWCQRLIVSVAASALPRLGTIALDEVVLAFATALGALAALLFGAAPAVQLSNSASGEALKEGGRSGAEGGRARVRSALVVGQVGIAVVLLVGAGLLIKSFVALTSVSAGFNPDGVITARVSLPSARYPGRPEIAAFFTTLLARLRSLPGVLHAGAASGLPLAVVSGDWGFDIEGRPRVNGRTPAAADWYVVTPGYFEALEIPLLRGRLPASSDTDSAPAVVFINETAARVAFRGEDPIGRRIRFTSTTGPEQPWRTIAGVVGDVRHRGLETAPSPEVFIPYQQFLHFSAGVQARAMTLVVKSASDPGALAGPMRAELKGLDSQIPAADVQSMDAVVGESYADRRLYVVLIGSFGGLALTLAVLGLYGLISYTVVQRRHELGVRIAIGASRGSVLSLVVAQGLRLAALGIAGGLLVAFVAAGSMADLLFRVEPRDVATFAAVPICLLTAGVLASYFPARRAMQVDPVAALRQD